MSNGSGFDHCSPRTSLLELRRVGKALEVAKDTLFGLTRARALGHFGDRRAVLWELGVLAKRLAMVLVATQGLYDARDLE